MTRIKLNVLPPGTMIRYIRERDFWSADDPRRDNKKLGRRPLGIFLALKTDTAYKLGYSLCNSDSTDRFSKEVAFNLAYRRCTASRPLKFSSVNPKIKNLLSIFTDRCRTYYKHGPFREPENWLAGEIPTRIH